MDLSPDGVRKGMASDPEQPVLSPVEERSCYHLSRKLQYHKKGDIFSRSWNTSRFEARLGMTLRPQGMEKALKQKALELGLLNSTTDS